MALQVAYTDPKTGASTETAYVRIEDIHITLRDAQITLLVSLYWSQEAAQEGKEPIRKLETIRIPQNLAAGTFRNALLTQMYTYLRTLPRFDGAENV